MLEPMQTVLDFSSSPYREAESEPTHGVVYTLPWVVQLILDLVGYRPETDLTRKTILEPSFGEGAFLTEIVRRLVASKKKHRRSWEELADGVVGVELSPSTADGTRRSLLGLLTAAGAPAATAEELLRGWIRCSDFLLDDSLFGLSVDAVVGNPPYVRQEAVDPDKLREYRRRYSSMKGRADLYIPFFEKGLRLLKPEGRLGFICADRWTLNAYGGSLREIITEDYAVDTFIDMHDAEAFDSDVLAYPAVTIIRNGEQQGTVLARLQGELSPKEVSALVSNIKKQREGARHPDLAKLDTFYRGSQPWPGGSPARLQLLRKLEEEFPLIEDAGVKVGIGIATGNDKVFITTDSSVVESSRLLPLAMGRDTTSGCLEWSGHYLVNPWNDTGLVNLDRYPLFAEYMDSHAAALRRRHVARRNPDNWYRTIDRVVEGLREQEKLLIPDIKDRLHPVLDRGSTYPHHNLYFMTSTRWPIEALGGILLSKVAEFFVASYCTRMAGGFLRFQAQYLRRIRIPSFEAVPEETVRALSSAFLARDVETANRLAYRLYGIDSIPDDEP